MQDHPTLKGDNRVTAIDHTTRGQCFQEDANSSPRRTLPFVKRFSRPAACAFARYGLLRILLFFGLFIGLLYATHFAISAGLRQVETSTFGVTNRIVTGRINADIVISGSSRAVTHYDPRIIERVTGLSAFNIGRNGSQTDLQLAVLKTYLQHNRKPKLVIHNLDSFSFVTSHEIYDPAQYMPYLGQPPIYDAVRKVYPDAWKWKYFPLYAYVVADMRFTWITGIKRLMSISPREDHIEGFTPRFNEWTGDFEAFRTSNPQGVAFEIEPQGVRDLTDLVAICSNQGIPVLLVYSPVYHEMQQMERNRTEIFGLFREVADRFGVSVWDFSSSAISKDRNLFYNSQHLNAQGAWLFTEELAKRLTQSPQLP